MIPVFIKARVPQRGDSSDYDEEDEDGDNQTSAAVWRKNNRTRHIAICRGGPDAAYADYRAHAFYDEYPRAC